MIYVHAIIFLLVADSIYYATPNEITNTDSGWGYGRNERRRRPGRPNQNQVTDGYVCVPIGTCPGGGIDPRIVTPNQPVCPPGQIPCYTISQGLTQCGIRTVSPINTEDGPTTNGAFPWQAFIENQTQFTGSGVLLDRYHVLTAAHKVNLNVNSPQNVRVYMGVWNPAQKNSAQMRTGSRVTVHPCFNSASLVNDIAIIRLNQPVDITNNVIPICLPAQQQSFVNQRCIVSGWGQTGFGNNDAARYQRQVNVNIVNFEQCRNSMAPLLGSNLNFYLDPNSEICAGGGSNRDACTQDGGAPLVCPDGSGRQTVAGLVIWGIGCGRANVYGVYVDVAKFRNWIDSVLNGQFINVNC